MERQAQPAPVRHGDVVYQECRIRHVYADEEREDQETFSVVTFRGDYIIVSYDDEEEEDGTCFNVRYWGKDHGHGHYELKSMLLDTRHNTGEGRATLHRLTPESSVLEGFWKEVWDTGDARCGAWQITLGECRPPSAVQARRCPSCNSGWVVPIRYGERPVDPDYHGQYVNGGCGVEKEKWHCMSCDTAWS